MTRPGFFFVNSNFQQIMNLVPVHRPAYDF